MRRKIIAGNWKMNKDLSETQQLISNLISGLNSLNPNCEIIICPPFTSLQEANSLIRNTSIRLGAQNMYFEESGAFTGEISPTMLKSVGCEYVILGHSERRTIFNESDEMINRKVLKALAAGLKPVFCIGETLQQRENGETRTVVKEQLQNGLKSLGENNLAEIIIAYEPVWAIGTGKNATPEQAQEVHTYIRNLLASDFTEETARNIIILYGGSVKPDNAANLLKQPDIDGALVGGACLNAESFLAIINAV